MEKEEGKTGEIEIELTLGLSMNGKFGVDPIGSNKLKRSCSTTSNSQETTRLELTSPGTTSCWGRGEVPPRTCSLPNRKKMKELHCLPLPNRKTAVTANKVNYEDEDEDEDEDENGFPRMVSQRSTGSSGLSELEIQATPLHGMNRITEAKSPQSVQSFSEQKEHKVKPARSILAPNGMVQNALADMPCVSAKGEGPNGKRVDGFLYGYKKGEEVRIVCVCHGDFLTPAEFVKHAGGGAVEHPLRHIIVNPSPSL